MGSLKARPNFKSCPRVVKLPTYPMSHFQHINHKITYPSMGSSYPKAVQFGHRCIKTKPQNQDV